MIGAADSEEAGAEPRCVLAFTQRSSPDEKQVSQSVSVVFPLGLGLGYMLLVLDERQSNKLVQKTGVFSKDWLSLYRKSWEPA